MTDAHPGPRRYAELVADRGRHRATRGLVSPHRGIWIPEHAHTHWAASCEALCAVRPDAVVTGWTAAAFHGHQWVPFDAPVEVAAGARRLRRPGVLAHQYEVPRHEVETFLGPTGGTIPVASAAWTLFDLARLRPRGEAVVALDGTDHMPVSPRSAVLTLAGRHPEHRGGGKARLAVSLHDARSESPKETELRLFLLDAGFTGFVPQYRVPGLRHRLDLADPEHHLGVEYDGAHHRDPGQHAADVRRWNALRHAGWSVYPVTSAMLRSRRDRDRLVEQIRAALARPASPPTAPAAANKSLPQRDLWKLQGKRVAE